MIIPRRSLFGFGAALIAAPAIVRVSSLMPISAPKLPAMPGIFMGAGHPVSAAGQGSLYVRTDVSPPAIYVNADGNLTTWVKLAFQGAPT